MAKYKVDKKLFDQRVLEEQLKQVELQSKYLKDEPLMRSEVDEYYRLKANDWVKNSLISLGIVFATLIASVVFVLLGNMLMTNGRTGDVDTYNLDSSAIYTEFENSDVFPAPSVYVSNITVIDYAVPGKYLSDVNHDVYITYRLEWIQTYNSVDNSPIVGEGYWVVGKSDNTIGYLTQSNTIGVDTDKYALDVKQVDLNDLMTSWFKGQEDGWAKDMVKWFGSAWPLTLVLWMVFISSIFAYAIVLVVGIRYVIRTIIVILRKAGYLASDFVNEVVDTVRFEIPIVDSDVVEDIDFTKMKDELSRKLEEDKIALNIKTEAEEAEVEEVIVKEQPKVIKKKVIKKEVRAVTDVVDEPVEVDNHKEPKATKKKLESEKSATDKMKDIFD